MSRLGAPLLRVICNPICKPGGWEADHCCGRRDQTRCRPSTSSSTRPRIAAGSSCSTLSTSTPARRWPWGRPQPHRRGRRYRHRRAHRRTRRTQAPPHGQRARAHRLGAARLGAPSPGRAARRLEVLWVFASETMHYRNCKYRGRISSVRSTRASHTWRRPPATGVDLRQGGPHGAPGSAAPLCEV